MFEDYRYYLQEEYDFAPSTRFGIGLAIWTIGGFLGFVYEILFYWANTGFQTFYWRGGTFGPWIEVYSIASLMIYLVLYRLRRQPWFVILISAAGCTLIQLLVGVGLYYLFDGARAWNYNLEILNYGNFGGFICLRSAIEFAVLGILIIYVIAPLIYKMAYHIRRSAFAAIWIIIGFVCLADMIYNDIVCVFMPSLISASDLYQSFGLRFMKY